MSTRGVYARTSLEKSADTEILLEPFVCQFMRGLKNKKASEYVPAKAVSISLDMITVHMRSWILL
ncbi:hypothetical protein F442_16828 [Phytophthora nicotianae P10297]|uniref:Uncharacterized protein n=1 Tax=Phytophthora nicotianae P10297 TaxID=1317064 RepID=W2YJ25_PHYNI|nr:hypothetical protein F442_16828 [Phytophthora nicotianae P10297]